MTNAISLGKRPSPSDAWQRFVPSIQKTAAKTNKLPAIDLFLYAHSNNSHATAALQRSANAQQLIVAASSIPFQIKGKSLKADTVVLAADALTLGKVKIDARVVIIAAQCLQVGKVQFSGALQQLIVVADSVSYPNKTLPAHATISSAHMREKDLLPDAAETDQRTLSVSVAQHTKDGEKEKVVIDQQQLAEMSSTNCTVLVTAVHTLIPEGRLASNRVVLATNRILSLGLTDAGVPSKEPVEIDAATLTLAARQIAVGNVKFTNRPAKLNVNALDLVYCGTPAKTIELFESFIHPSSS